MSIFTLKNKYKPAYKYKAAFNLDKRSLDM